MTQENKHHPVVTKFPMGPSLRKWWQLETTAMETQKPSKEEDEVFCQEFLKQIPKAPCKSHEEITSLMKELMAMNFPLLALKVCDGNQGAWQKHEFSGQRLEGLCSLLVGEMERAENAFIVASELAPKEVACYVNLIKIMIEEERWEEAWQWAHQGLSCQPNHFPLWKEIVALLQEEGRKDPLPIVRDLEKKYNSWAAASLLSEWESSPSPEKKLARLESYYQHGELSYDFLMEYTGALGVTGNYKKIPQVIYQAQTLNGQHVPWQLKVHSFQAQMALEDFVAAKKEGQDLLSRKDLSPSTIKVLKEMMKEVEEKAPKKGPVHETNH